MWKIAVGIMMPLLILSTSCQSSRTTVTTAAPQPDSSPMTQNSKSPSTAVTYVALGDSTGAGVGAQQGGYVARLFQRLRNEQAQARLVNLCVSGATTSDVLRGQLETGIRANPDLVTLGIGINDIGHGLSLEQFSKNYEEILTQLKKRTHARIVVTNIPDISSAPRIPATMRSEYQKTIIEFNRRLEEVANRSGATIFDIYTITAEQLPSHPEYFSADGFHPSDKGYELWAEQMWPTVEKAVSGE